MNTHKNRLKIFGLLLLFLCTSRFAWAINSTQNCVPTTKAVSALFTQWNDALKTKNPDTVTALYVDNAVLLPTLSNKPRTNHAEIRAYFVDFLKKNPVARLDQTFLSTGCNWATNTGIYTFKLWDEQSKTTKEVQARYSYVYEKIDGKWLIIHHHSSLMPEANKTEEVMP
jgi:uncharacterized protein (TIGR02246 family)